MDELERQITARRRNLDQAEEMDQSSLWKAIDQRLPEHRTYVRVRRYRRLLFAASFLLIILSAALIWQWKQEDTLPTKLGDLSPELAEQEENYLSLISKKESTLQLEELDKTLYGPFLEELKLVDSLQEEYFQELPQYGNEVRMVNTLIRFYELKIRILSQIENELLKQENYDNSNTTTKI